MSHQIRTRCFRWYMQLMPSTFKKLAVADMATNANGNKECYILTPPRRFVFVLPWFPVHRARNGYWKKDGYTDLEIYGNNGIVGVKQKFHFYEGGINNGRKTNWYMIEYSLKEHCCSVTCDHENGRLENWVVCKIYQDFGPDHLTSEIQKLNI
ncbi:hypothetical protein JCGZ_21919 [Jatropha curcas]|uniref:NAC domain-containing protein n=1 Tax=Jatropha curcas TaxID=180498 RepID=A0A067JF84_JATCU|nr:hypothetical protein JCGZ_21919 [Jatropha curcas]